MKRKMKDDENEQRGSLDGASADQHHHFWCCLPLHWKPLLYDQVATIFFKVWLSFRCKDHGCQIGNPGNDDDNGNGAKDEDRPDQQHHWKSLLYDDQVATIMVANLAILADVIRVVRTKLRRDQTHVSRLFVL